MAYVVLASVVNQLSTFLREESELLGGVRDEVQHIKDELGQMKGFLRRAEAIVENNPELEAWASQVRDVAYDVEDIIDEFIQSYGGHYGDGFLGQVQKVYRSIRNLKSRHQIASKIHIIKDRIINISQANQRYQNQNQHRTFELGSSSAIEQNQNRNRNQNQNAWYDSRGDAFLVEEADLVGIEWPKKELMNMLLTSDSQLRVVSIVGMGGLGKTTLVKKVYDDPNVKKQFKHHAWITVSQSFKIETLFKQTIQQLLKELNQPLPVELDTMDIDSMKRLVRDLLCQGNYILVFDDIWRTTDWDAIRVVFPENSHGSRIMMTSRIINVGQAAMTNIRGDIYHLKPLTKEESWNLFCKKAFRDTSCPPHHLRKISENIIERCNGLPLAIVVIAGVLARQSHRTEEWDLFNRSLGEQLAGEDQLDNMTKIISLSYYNLPDNLRICLLSLSIFPEDVFIEKGMLVRLWIAEGFVQKKEGMTKEEVAEGYLNDHINRSLVQVAKRTSDGRVKKCQVHDIIHQIILRKARELDITTIVSEQGMEFPGKVRRLVIHSSFDNTQVSNGLLKYLRSLVMFGSIGSMSEPFLSRLLFNGLRLLRVLELQGAPLEAIPHEIFKMFHLKYLSLRKTILKTVPKSIGKLKKLETLDLRDTNVRVLPVEILKLLQLRHLLVGRKFEGVEAPYKIGNLQALQSLRNIGANQTGILKDIGKLTQLRKLGVVNLRREDGKELCSSIEKLINLRSLRVVSEFGEVIDLQYALSSTPRFLHTLVLYGQLNKVPQWIPSLHALTRLHLWGSRLRDDPLQLLQDLPNLVQLVLCQASEGEELCFKAGGFQGLKYLSLWDLPKLSLVRMEKGAMPFLERLGIRSCILVEELPVGIEHLISLQLLDFFNMSDRFVKKLKHMDEVSADYKKIAHIPQVLITNWVGGEIFKQRNLSKRM